MDLTTIIVGGSLSAFFSFLVGIALYRTQKQSERMDEFAKSIVTLQNTAVTDEHVRKVVKEEVQPVIGQLQSINASVHNIEIFMAQERGYRAGIAQTNKD
jgi:hypothetical protein